MRYFPFFAVLSVAIVSLLVYQDKQAHASKSPVFRYSPSVSTWQEEIAAQEKHLIKSIIWHKAKIKVLEINSSEHEGMITF
jgi:hypothetical protein